MFHLKKTLFRYLIILKIGGRSSATIKDEAYVERRSLLSAPRFTASYTLAENKVKLFLGVLYTALFVMMFVQYRQCTYERAWNVAVLTRKTQVMGTHLGQVRTCPPQFPR